MAKPTHARVMARHAHRAHTKEFLKAIASVERAEGWREEQAFTHFLSASARALFSVVHRWTGQHATLAANEAEYLKLVGLCRHPKETMAQMALLYAIIEDALMQEPADILTPIFGEIAASASLGQFFTPYSLSLASARMAIDEPVAMLERVRAEGGSFIRCLEPACGVGGMILAGNEVFREHGIDVARHVHWVGVDLDWRAFCGAYLQVTLTGASADLVHGNALSGETFVQVPTLMAVWHPKRQRSMAKDVTSDVACPPAEPVITQGVFDFMTERAA